MKAFSLPNLNRDTTSFPNFFTLFQDPNNHDDTTLNKHPNIDHSQDTEPSETSPFKRIPSPSVSFNEMNENHYPVGGSFYELDWDQMDQTLPGWPPSPNGSDTNVSVGSNQFSSVSSNDGARMKEVWTTITSYLIDDGHAWRKCGQKLIPNATHPREYFRCTHRYGQGCRAKKKVQKTDEDPPIYLTTYYRNHTCRNPPALGERVPLDVIDDGHAWRKYGHKLIPNARHPRYDFFTHGFCTQFYLERFLVSNKWKRIWRCIAPTKMKLFLCRSLYNILRVNQNLVKKKVPADEVCPVCGLTVESISHMLFQCDRACRVWLLSPLRLRPETLASIHVGELWTYVEKITDGESKWERLGLFATVGWHIWKARNTWVFKKEWIDEKQILGNALTDFFDFCASNAPVPRNPEVHEIESTN